MSYSNNNTANRNASYTVTFTVNLSPSFAYPNANGNQTLATLASFVSTWIPQGKFLGDETRVLKHGDQFTAYDDAAKYLKDRFVYDATTNPYGVLTVVTETL